MFSNNIYIINWYASVMYIIENFNSTKWKIYDVPKLFFIVKTIFHIYFSNIA